MSCHFDIRLVNTNMGIIGRCKQKDAWVVVLLFVYGLDDSLNYDMSLDTAKSTWEIRKGRKWSEGKGWLSAA